MALGKPVAVSAGPYNATSAAQVTNGNTDTADWMDVGPNPQWVTVDLGQSYNLNGVRLRHYYGDGRTYYDVIVQLSNSPDFASGVATVFNNDADNSAGQGAGSDPQYAETPAGRAITFGEVSARYVRAWVNGSTANTSGHFVEVEAWA